MFDPAQQHSQQIETDVALVPLGVCDDFDEAFEKAETKCPNSHWVFSRYGLEEFKSEILRELP